MTDKTTIIEKIKKLFALANGTPNEHEAAAAVEKARQLLEAYSLSHEDLIDAEQITTENIIHNRRQVPQWLSFLANVVAKHFNCYYITRRKKNQQPELVLVGSPTDIEVAAYTLEFLKNTINALTEKIIVPQNTPVRKWRDSYRLGLITSIEKTLQQLKTASGSADQARADGLIIRKDTAVLYFIKRHFPKLKQAPTRTIAVSPDSYLEGLRDGSSISLIQGVKSDSVRQIA